ncbi:MAG: DUF945 family protein [Pseudomonadota bacterium]
MKKTVVIIIVVLALVVLITPGVIGHLAESSLDENLDFAADESRELILTSSNFERGWFTSEGRHEFEVGQGELRRIMLERGLVSDNLPTIVIDTRLDHGLVPVSSLQRDNGTLAPGLGNAVSTVSFEFAGVPLEFPGTFYSHVGVSGALESRLVMEPGDIGDIRWNAVDLTFIADAAAQRFGIQGDIGSFAIEEDGETVIVGEVHIDAVQTLGDYGLVTGPAEFFVESFSIVDANGAFEGGPLTITSDAVFAGSRINYEAAMTVDRVPFPPVSDNASVSLALRFTGFDAESLGRLQAEADAMSDDDDDIPPGLIDAAADLFAAGFEIHFDEFSIGLPEGQADMTLHASIAEVDADEFSWPGALFSSIADGRISIPAPIMETLMQLDDSVPVVVGMGYLSLQDGHYVSELSLADGVVTINGAPTPLAPLLGISN